MESNQETIFQFEEVEEGLELKPAGKYLGMLLLDLDEPVCGNSHFESESPKFIDFIRKSLSSQETSPQTPMHPANADAETPFLQRVNSYDCSPAPFSHAPSPHPNLIQPSIEPDSMPLEVPAIRNSLATSPISRPIRKHLSVVPSELQLDLMPIQNNPANNSLANRSLFGIMGKYKQQSSSHREIGLQRSSRLPILNDPSDEGILLQRKPSKREDLVLTSVDDKLVWTQSSDH